LGVAEIREIVGVLHAAEAADGESPLSEAPLLALRNGLQEATHLVVRVDGRLVGYAGLDAEARVGELVVAPASRRQGIGAAMIAARRAPAPAPPQLLWAHGDTRGQRAFARATCGRAMRELLLMELRPLPDTPPRPTETTTPFHLRAFDPEHDPDALVELNALVFTGHPEQGAMTRRDFDLRMREPWFDPAGIIVAHLPAAMGGALAGFVWTKIGKESATTGEIYVLGVHPSFQGRGLGLRLLRAGLAHLRRRGVVRAILYVDGTSHARRLYERTGFALAARDIQYEFPPRPAGGT
jgi:mycothiol synthase